jgi:diacylglycerol kinase
MVKKKNNNQVCSNPENICLNDDLDSFFKKGAEEKNAHQGANPTDKKEIKQEKDNSRETKHAGGGQQATVSSPKAAQTSTQSSVESTKPVNQKNYAFDAKNFFESYWYALSGIKLIITNERNFRIQLITVILVIGLGLFFQVSHTDWVFLSLVTALVLISESFNSVIEAVCDTVSQEYRVNIRYAKNVSAGAVLVSAMVSLVTGIIIFAPYVLEFLAEVLPK